MSKLEETIAYMKNEIDCQIHFSECWDETLFLTLAEVDEFLSEIDKVIHSEKMSQQKKLQKIVDMITCE